MGRNPNEEKSQTQANDSSRSYSPYQSGEPQRTTEPAASTKASTESETTAREIKTHAQRLCRCGYQYHRRSDFQSDAAYRRPLFRTHHFQLGFTAGGRGGQVDANVEVAVARFTAW